MKVKSMGIALMMSAFLLSTTGCSKDSEKEESNDKAKVTLRVVMPGASTYAVESPTDNQKTPGFNDATIYFTDGNTIGKIVRYASTSGLTSTAGETIDNIPVAATKIYIIANEGETLGTGGQAGKLTNEAGTAVTIAAGDNFSKLQELMVRISAQVNPLNQLHLVGKSTFTPVPGGTASASIDLKPAVARMEIAKVEADGTVEAAKRVTKFDLQGIYINNTFGMISIIDNAKYPAVANAIAYDYKSSAWSTAGTYPAAFCNEYINLKDVTSYTAGGTNIIWGYYVVPAQKKEGSAYVGNSMDVNVGGVATSRQFGACPLVVLKVNNVMVDSKEKNPGKNDKSYYVTVSKYYDESKALINYFEGGYVYDIANISFNNDHLSDEPNIAATATLSVNVKVNNWVRKSVTPGF